MDWTAVVLAGVRASGDAVADYCGVPVKALADVGGEPMLARVLRALDGVSKISEVLIVGDFELLAGLVDQIGLRTPVRWVRPGASPAMSLSDAFGEIPESSKVLVTTSDHALLKCRWVAEYIDEVDAANHALSLALASATAVRRALPNTRRTVIKFSDVEVCTCNLFAFCAPQARSVSRAWALGEGKRKSPLHLLARLGVVNAVLYGLGLLDMKRAFARLSRRFGVGIAPILMPYPLLAVDVDTREDLALCRRLVAREGAENAK